MRFFFHYNKPLSRKAGRPVLSVHFSGGCHFVHNVDVRVATKGRIRKRQPFFVMTGNAGKISVEDGVAIIED